MDDLPDATPGAIVRLELDQHHFLTLGYSSWLAAPMISRLAFTPSEEGTNVAVLEDPDVLVVSGFMWEDTRAALGGATYVVNEKRGKGQVILFAVELTFRAYWPVLHRLFLNAVLLAPSM